VALSAKDYIDEFIESNGAIQSLSGGFPLTKVVRDCKNYD